LKAGADRLVEEFSNPEPAARLAAIDHVRALPPGQITDRVLDSMIGCIGANSKTIQRRAIDALAAMTGDTRVVDSIRRALASKDRRIRWGAAYALAQIGNDSFAMHAADAIAEALADEDGDVRWAAAELFVRLGRDNPAGVRERLLALAANGGPNGRKMALYCFRDLGFSGADLLEILERAIHDPDMHIRLAALAVLARLKGSDEPVARITLECLESDPDAGVRRAAAATLGNLGGVSPRTLDALRVAADNISDISMQRAAKSALERLEKR
jgi:HEAT repeat protein